MLATIVTVNGKEFSFEADRVDIIEDRYVFELDGVDIASFGIKEIAGYYLVDYEDEEED